MRNPNCLYALKIETMTSTQCPDCLFPCTHVDSPDSHRPSPARRWRWTEASQGAFSNPSFRPTNLNKRYTFISTTFKTMKCYLITKTSQKPETTFDYNVLLTSGVITWHVLHIRVSAATCWPDTTLITTVWITVTKDTFPIWPIH